MNDPSTAVYHPTVGMPGLPFSEAVQARGLLFLAGQIGRDASGNLAPGGIGAETRQAMTNVRAVLERHGSSLDGIVKVTVMLADIGEWAAMNAEYVKFFPRHLPARSALHIDSPFPLRGRPESGPPGRRPIRAAARVA